MPSQTLRRLAGTAAVALAFSATANAAGLIDSTDALLKYSPAFSNAIANAAPTDKAPHLAARSFMKGLETVLKDQVPDSERYIFTGRDGKSGMLIYPKDNSTNMLVIASVVPPKGSEHLPIAVCAQQNRRVVGAWNISAKGDVTPREIVANPEGSTKPACNATILAARDQINNLAQSNQPAPTPYSAQPPAAGPTTMQSAKPAEMVAGVSCVLNEDPNQVSEARRLAQSSGSARLRDKMTRVLTECPNGKGLGEPAH